MFHKRMSLPAGGLVRTVDPPAVRRQPSHPLFDFLRKHPVVVLGVFGVTLVVGVLALVMLLDLKAPGGILRGAVWEAISDLDAAPAILLGGLLDYLALAWGLPEIVLQATGMLVIIGSLIGVFTGLFALTSIVERKMLARMQNRYGPNRVGPWGLLQPVADGIKMLIKEDIVPAGADRAVHFLAPLVMVVPALLSLAILPFGPGLVAVELGVGVLFFFSLGAATEVAVFMAGWGGNNKYALLGGMRAIAQMISYEVPLILATVAVVLVAGSLSPSAIVEAQGGWLFGWLPQWFVFTPWGFAGFILFFIAALAESNRSPFDLPEGESELVAGHLTEYSGFKYAVFFMAEYIGLFAISGLAVALFLGGWKPPLPVLAFVPGWAWFLAKLYMLVLVAIWIRGTVPRVRIDQLMAFAWTFLVPMGFVVVAAAAVWQKLGAGVAAWAVALPVVVVAYLALGRAFSKNTVAKTTRIYRYSNG